MGEQPLLLKRPLRGTERGGERAAHREGSRDRAGQHDDDEKHRAKAGAPAGRASPGDPHRARHRSRPSGK